MYKLKSFNWPFLLLLALHKLSISGAGCENILFLAGIGSPSHHIWNREITYALAERGHNITVISPNRDEDQPANVHYLQIDGEYMKLYGNLFKALSEPVQRPAAWQDVINYHSFCARTSGGKIRSLHEDNEMIFENYKCSCVEERCRAKIVGLSA